MAPSPVLQKAAKGISLSQTKISDFFKIKRVRGRPKKRFPLPIEVATVLHGKVSTSIVNNTVSTSIAKEKTPHCGKAKKKATAPVPPKTKTNWADGGKNQERLSNAVHDWMGKKGMALDGNGEVVSLSAFCNIVQIPYNTFKFYVCADEKKRRVVGSQMGRRPLINKETSVFIVDILARADGANEGKTPSEMLDHVVELNPSLSRKQASMAMYRTILPKYSAKRYLRSKKKGIRHTSTKPTINS
jgi:hypothetical protein